MYSSINISFDENELEFTKKYSFRQINGGLDIDIITNENESFSNIISNYDQIRNDLASYLNDMKTIYGDNEFTFLESLQNKEDNFYKILFVNIKYISLNGEHEQILTFLKNNPELKNKEIILEKDYNLNTELKEIEYLEEIYKDYKNINIILDGNKLPIRLENFKKTVSKINDITNEIKKYNFSELEQIMYAYDIARNALYVREDKNESLRESRDLTNVLLGNKRVCEGYANIFNAILNKLNIKCLVYTGINSEKNVGHAYNCVYVSDKKYKVKGVYFFDTTYDSRKNETSDYLYTYKHFGINKETIEMYHNNKYSEDQTFKNYSEQNIKELIKLLEDNNLEKANKDLIKTINKISYLIYGENLITKFRILKSINAIPSFLLSEKDNISNEELINKIKEINKYMNSNISTEVLIKVLYNVRKIEYYTNPEMYPFDIVNFKCVAYNSKWRSMNETALKLINVILGNANSNTKIPKTIEEIIEDNNIDLNIERIKLTKTLRKVLENNDK